jgi:hypothetical protein
MIHDRAPLAALAILIAGCSSSGTGTPDAPTYHHDVKPIVDARCGGCHVQGGIAPFALTTYAEVSAQKAAIKGAVSSRTMPPWPPAEGCNTYAEDRSLSDEEIATIGAWVDQGAPEGDPATAPPAEKPKEGLSRVDLTLEMPEAFTPTQAPDEYRCFLVDWPEQDTTYITGLGVQPGVASIVHHVIVYRVGPDQIADYQALDDAEPGPGYKCFGGPGGGASGTGQRIGWVGGWVPGSTGNDYAEGTGIEIVPGSKLVMQVHYNTSSAPAQADRTSLLLRTAKSVEKKASVMPFTDIDWVQNHKMNIPAHAMDATFTTAGDPTPIMSLLTSNALPSNAPFSIYSVGLHMHTRGTRAMAGIQRKGGGDACLLDIEKWNFHWQGSYDLAKPVTFNPGDQLTLECHFNNPDAQDVNWGEGTADEMCLGVFYVTE